MLYVAWKRGLPRKCARFVPFRLIKKRSFHLLCVLDLFAEGWQSILFQIFFFFLSSRDYLDCGSPAYQNELSQVCERLDVDPPWRQNEPFRSQTARKAGKISGWSDTRRKATFDLGLWFWPRCFSALTLIQWLSQTLPWTRWLSWPCWYAPACWLVVMVRYFLGFFFTPFFFLSQLVSIVRKKNCDKFVGTNVLRFSVVSPPPPTPLRSRLKGFASLSAQWIIYSAFRK